MNPEWSVEFLNKIVVDEFLSMPKDIQARFQRILRLIENNGLNALVMPLARHINGMIWEMRSMGRNGIARGLYVTASCRRVVVPNV